MAALFRRVSHSAPMESVARSPRAQRRLRALLALSLFLACSSLIALAFIGYFFGTTNWGLTLDPKGAHPLCLGNAAGSSSTATSVCTTTYEWTVIHSDVNGLAFANNILAQSEICGYVDAQGRSVKLNDANYQNITPAQLNSAPTLLIPQTGHDICDFTTSVNNGYSPLLISLGDFFIALLCALMAALIFFHGTQRNLVHHTVLFLLSLMLSFIILPLSFTVNGLIGTIESTVSAFIGITLLATLVWRLLLPKPQQQIWQQLRRGTFIFLFSINIGISLVLLLATIMQRGGLVSTINELGFLLVALNILITLTVIIWGNFSKRDLVLRDNARILEVGSIIALSPLLLLTILPTITQYGRQFITQSSAIQPPILDGSTAALTIVAFPLALAYVVLKRDLLRTDVLVRNSTEQGIWLLFLALFSGIILSVLTAIPGLKLAPQVSITLFVVLLVAGAMAPLLRRGAIWVTEAGLFPEIFRYKRVLRKAASGAGQTEEEAIAGELLGEIKLAIPVRAAALLVHHDVVASFEDVSGAGVAAIPEDHPWLAEVRIKPRAKMREDLTVPPPFADPAQGQWACFAPIFLEQRLVGVLLLGTREDGLGYTTADRELVFTLANRRAVALDYSRILTVLRGALEEQKRIDELKDQFIMTAHHELRTPLTSMIGYMDIVAQLGIETWQKKPEEIEFLVGEALRSGEDLVHLLDTLLQADRDSINHPELHPTLVDLASALRDFANDAEIAADQHQRISLHCASGLTGWVDRKAFGQVITNLLSNAIKYSPAGTPIEVEARTVPDGSMVEVTVRDHGDGIPLDQQAAIFEKFIRLERDLNSTTRGTGLGLAIVRERMEALGGKVWVVSTGIPGKGSTFHVTFPIAQAVQAPATSTNTPTVPKPQPTLVPASTPAVPAEDDSENSPIFDEKLDTLPRHKLVRYGPPPEEKHEGAGG